jgi:hypothetical protein
MITKAKEFVAALVLFSNIFLTAIIFEDTSC